MSERTMSLCLPPLFETDSCVGKCNMVGIETFAVGSVYRNELRREVQHLTELRFLYPDLFLGRLAPGDVGHGADELAIAGRIIDGVRKRVDVFDSSVS